MNNIFNCTRIVKEALKIFHESKEKYYLEENHRITNYYYLN